MILASEFSMTDPSKFPLKLLIELAPYLFIAVIIIGFELYSRTKYYQRKIEQRRIAAKNHMRRIDREIKITNLEIEKSRLERDREEAKQELVQAIVQKELLKRRA